MYYPVSVAKVKHSKKKPSIFSLKLPCGLAFRRSANEVVVSLDPPMRSSE
jgi:hypothetical protein